MNILDHRDGGGLSGKYGYENRSTVQKDEKAPISYATAKRHIKLSEAEKLEE